MPKAGLLAVQTAAILHLLSGSSSQILVTRRHPVDTFSVRGLCRDESCLSQSMGTAVSTGGLGGCSCTCLPHLPAFREDLHICVDDLHDCPLIPFMSGTTYQKIPYVFLPLKGQIVYPSAELVFAGAESPICVVSAARFLSPGGWEDLRNRSDAEPPFRLFPDEGRTFLQWLGDTELRENLEGRLVLVHLMCKDMVDEQNPTNNIFTSCLSFRVAGTPSDINIQNGVKEVSFSVDSQLQGQNMGSSYIVIAVSSVLLGLIYISSVMFYIQGRKRKSKFSEPRSGPLGVAEEGVVKNNPLLTHCHENPGVYLSDGPPSCSESDEGSEIAPPSDELTHSVQTTSVLIHPCTNEKEKKQIESPFLMQDTSNMERLPEENVSIIETMDLKEERPETVRAMTTTNGRRKLYFNPAYFEPELLLAPPPAAIEFLTKIREVIAIAKAKMEAKRFFPSLMGIPEEMDYSMMKGSSMAGSESTVIFRREHSNRHKSCFHKHYRHSEQGCHNCCRNSEQKQSSIQKWLENVPLATADDETTTVGSSHKDNMYNSHETSSIKSISIKSDNKSDESIYANREVIDNCENMVRNVNSSNSLNGTKEMKSPIKANTKENEAILTMNSKCKKITAHPKSPDKLSYSSSKSNNETGSTHINKKDQEMPEVTNNFKENIVKENEKSQAIYEEKILWIDDVDDGMVTKPNNYSFSTSSDYANNDPELMNKINSAKSNRITSNSKQNKGEDNDYETIMQVQHNKENQSLGDLLNKSCGYSLVSEVYVNDGCDYVSESSQSNLSSLNSNMSDDEVEYDRTDLGHLTIKVKDDPPMNYTNESDSFEPDTLDRKPNKLKINQEITINIEKTQDIYADSLERPQQISLKSTGTFKSDATWSLQESEVGVARHPLNRAFGSLREIFEAKTKYNQCTHNKSIRSCSPVGSTKSLTNDLEITSMQSWKRGKPKLLRPEAKQAKRQRSPSPPNQSILKPPLIGDPEQTTISNTRKSDGGPPLPPRIIKPPLPPKNGDITRTSNEEATVENKHVATGKFKPTTDSNINNITIPRCSQMTSQQELIIPKEHTCHKSQPTTSDFKSINEPKSVKDKKNVCLKRQQSRPQNRTEDSGYLSTDSNGSDSLLKREDSISETDDSFFDGASESGAESIATDSFFFGKFRKSLKPYSPDNSSPSYSDNLEQRNNHSPHPS